MRDIVTAAVLVAFFIALLFAFSKFHKFLAKMTQDGVRKNIERGKIKDKDLIRFYHFANKGRYNKVIAFFSYGIYFRTYLEMQEGNYQLYREEMIKRGLLNEAD